MNLMQRIVAIDYKDKAFKFLLYTCAVNIVNVIAFIAVMFFVAGFNGWASKQPVYTGSLPMTVIPFIVVVAFIKSAVFKHSISGRSIMFDDDDDDDDDFDFDDL